MKCSKNLKIKLLISFVSILWFSYFSITAQAETLVKRLAGRILLQVESKGEAWYVDPVSLRRIYLRDGDVAYQLLHDRGLGIINVDLAKIPVGMEPSLGRFQISDWNFFIDQKLGVELQYPQHWSPEPDILSIGDKLFVRTISYKTDPPKFNSEGSEYFHIERNRNVSKSLDNWYREKAMFTEESVQGFIALWETTMGKGIESREEYTVEDSLRTKISNYPAIAEYQRGPTSYNLSTRKKQVTIQKNYYVKVGSDIYLFRAVINSGDRMDERLKLFDTIMSTVRFSADTERDENFFGSNNTDKDGDGLSDKLEASLQTDPDDPDSDHDSYLDGVEVLNGYNPLGQGRLIRDEKLINKLKGRILLQVQSKGEAWYVHPVDGKRYYMSTGNAAYHIMKFLSLGVKNTDLDKIPK